ncbi:MAG: hypothetical protein WAT74_04320, partial [Flavobacteriales bacterium]
YGIGVQGGAFVATGAWEARQELDERNGWMAGLQWVEGGQGTMGFRIGLDAGQRRYSVKAKHDLDGMQEEFESMSNLLWLSFELRWRLTRKHRLFFELGPVIGAEIGERRTGVRVFEGFDLSSGPYRREVPVEESEHGFAIRDGLWRIGVTGEWPVASRWFVTTGLHLCPGVGNWAREHGYATLDASARAGLLYMVSDGKDRGRRR